MSKTHLLLRHRFEMNEYAIHWKVKTLLIRGVTLIIQDDILHTLSSEHDRLSENVEIINIGLTNGIKVVDIHKHPRYTLTTNGIYTFTEIGNKVAVLWDFNVRHVCWNCNGANPTENSLYRCLQENKDCYSTILPR